VRQNILCTATVRCIQSRSPCNQHRPCFGLILLAGQTKRADETRAIANRDGFAKILVALLDMHSSFIERSIRDRHSIVINSMQELFRLVLLSRIL
jgi:hypothetical protein